MSDVTNVILHVSICEKAAPNSDEDILQVEDLNKRLFARINQEFSRIDPYAGGSKFFETFLFAAAFNHVSTSILFEEVARTKWAAPEDVQLFIMRQEEDVFSVYGWEEIQRLTSPHP